MPASNAISGSSAVLSLGATPIAEWRKVDFKGKGKMIDVSSSNNTSFEEFVAGKRGGTISVEVNFYPGDTGGQLAVLNAWLAGTLLTGATAPKLSRSTGGPNLSGPAYIENFNWSAPGNDDQTATFDIRFTGTIAYSAT